MPNYNIFISDGLDERGQAILRASANVDYHEKVSADDLLKLIPECDALIVRGQTRVTAAVMEAASRLKVIGRAGVGVDNIDLEAAKKHKIAVVNAPTSTTVAVAELSFGLLLAVAREIPRADATMKEGQWSKKEFEGVELNGKTLGIIGYGRIGIEVGKRAAGFGMNVIVYDPNVSEDELLHSDAEPVSIQDLFAWSDFISLHLPLNVQTRDLMGPLAFSQMKDGVRIVCAARGGIIDESALVDALNSGKVHEYVVATLALDEPVPLGVVEPLDLACNAHRFFFLACWWQGHQTVFTGPIDLMSRLANKKKDRERGLSRVPKSWTARG